MTGRHLSTTPAETRPAQDFLDELADEYATVPAGTPEALTHESVATKKELANVETTTDIQDVFDAIQHVRPGDIRLRSSVTEERADGSKSLDPSWAHSESGTRLAQVGDGWVYRKGMHGLDALQVVALEERIIHDEGAYPSGADFWDAVEALRERGAHIPEYDASTTESDPVSALPFVCLDALDDSERRRTARRRGFDWPDTDRARERLRERLLEAVRHQEEVVIDAPTGLGKSYTVATEPWRYWADVTGGQPVVHLSPTRDARDQALAHSRDADSVAAAVLRGRAEACPVARGCHDPGGDNDDHGDGDDDDVDDHDQEEAVPVTMNGMAASDWFDAVCDGRGVPFSTAHAYLAEHNDQGITLPCYRGETVCLAIAQWDGLPRTEEGDPAVDVIHATHQFAYVPSLVQSCTVVFDEQPDFSVDTDCRPSGFS